MSKLLIFVSLICFVRVVFAQINSSYQESLTLDLIEKGKNVLHTTPDQWHDSVDWETFGIKVHPEKNNYFDRVNKFYNFFQEIKYDCKKERISKDTLAEIFTETLVNDILPYWYGTDWAFDGKVDTPQYGPVTCGYFTAITLNHMGVNIDKSRFSSMLPVNMVYSIALEDTVFTFKDSRYQDVISFIKGNLSEGLYLAGLFNHIGYLLFRNGEVFFIHANYFEPSRVIIEKAFYSEAFRTGRHYYITRLSSNNSFLEKWLYGRRIRIVKREKF